MSIRFSRGRALANALLLTAIVLAAVLIPRAAHAASAMDITDPSILPPQNIRVKTTTSTWGLTSEEISAGKRFVTLSWKATAGATKYQIWVADESNNFIYTRYKTIKKKKLKMKWDMNSNTYFLVRGVNTKARRGQFSEPVVCRPGIGNSKNTDRIWISSSPAVYVGRTARFTAGANGTLNAMINIRWFSSNKKVATVNKETGIVTGKKKGTVKIYAMAHNGLMVSKKIKVTDKPGMKVPKLVGLSKEEAVDALKQQGLKARHTTIFYTPAKYNSLYPASKFKKGDTIVRQDTAAGMKLDHGDYVFIYSADIRPTVTATGVEGMVQWAEKIAKDDRFGYSMGVYQGIRQERHCGICQEDMSLDYDCASFVTAALAHTGWGKDFEKVCAYRSPVVGGVADLLLKNGWERVYGKKKSIPKVSQLKRGDVLVNRRSHIEIYAGDGMDVGAHEDYDGVTGDSSGREVSIARTWSFYNEVYRYKGK